MTYMTDSKTNTNTPSIRSLSAVDLSAVSGGTQVYVHEFGIGSVNMATGLRPFEPKMPASPDPEAGLGAYGSTNNNLPGWDLTSVGINPTVECRRTIVMSGPPKSAAFYYCWQRREAKGRVPPQR
jgi:hypothetical protein